MFPGLEMLACPELAVPAEVMQHVVRVESSFNPYAIGVVGARLVRQPRNLGEAVSTARMLEEKGYNFSLGLAQVNRYNLASQGLDSYEKAFEVCPNLQAGSRILAECHGRAGGDWGKALSCYYSGNFTRGFRDGYVQKVFASWQGRTDAPALAGTGTATPGHPGAGMSLVDRRVFEAGGGARRLPGPMERPSRIQPLVQGGSASAPVSPASANQAAHQAAPYLAQPAVMPPPAPGAPPVAAPGVVDDGPVTVQLMGHRPAPVPPRPAPAPAPVAVPPVAAQATHAGGAHVRAEPVARDSAFVF